MGAVVFGCKIAWELGWPFFSFIVHVGIENRTMLHLTYSVGYPTDRLTDNHKQLLYPTLSIRM